jgi:hypothetical protein
MKSAKSLIWILLLGIILFNWMVLYRLSIHESRHYIKLPINFPKEEENPYQFSEKNAWALTKNKKKIRLTLDGNTELNRKKFDILLYETRKMRYTLDSSMVIIIDFTNDTPYGEFLKIVRLCNDEMMYTYAPVKKAFIITGLYRIEKKEDTVDKIEFIYM